MLAQDDSSELDLEQRATVEYIALSRRFYPIPSQQHNRDPVCVHVESYINSCKSKNKHWWLKNSDTLDSSTQLLFAQTSRSS